MKWLFLSWMLQMAAPSTVAEASTAILPAQARATAALVLLNTQYSADRNVDYNATGTMLFGGYKTAINPRFALGGGVGILFDGETTGDIKVKNGNGYRLAVDTDIDLTHFANNEVIGSIGLTRDALTYKRDGVKLEMTQTDLILGLMVRRNISKLNIYGGLQIFLLDKGTLNTTFASGSGSSDNNRQDRLNLRLGMTVAADPTIDLRLDLVLFGEQTILLGADIKV